MKKILYSLLSAMIVFAFTALPALAQKADQPPKPQATEKAEKPAKSATAKPAVTGKLNINTATADQIAMLPGVTPKKAQGLVEYRAKNGNFKSMDDLKKLPGIKQKKLDKLKDLIIFEGESTLKPVK